MKDYGTVRSVEQPEETVIDDLSVWVSSDIEELTTTDAETGEENTEYSFTLTQYSLSEYLLMQNELMTSTELALCELYESINA